MDVPDQSLPSTPLVQVMRFSRAISRQTLTACSRRIDLPWPYGGARQQFNTRARFSRGSMTAFPWKSLQPIPVSRLSSHRRRDGLTVHQDAIKSGVTAPSSIKRRNGAIDACEVVDHVDSESRVVSPAAS